MQTVKVMQTLKGIADDDEVSHNTCFRGQPLIIWGGVEHIFLIIINFLDIRQITRTKIHEIRQNVAKSS